MPISVIHSHPVWLQLTQNWMHKLVQSIPEELVSSHVVCNRRINANGFSVDSLHCLEIDSPLTATANKVLSKIRLGRFRIDNLSKKIKQLDASIVHSHFGQIGAKDWKKVKQSGAKHVVTFYGVDVSRSPQKNPSLLKKYHQMFRSSDLFLAEGPHLGKQLEGLGCPAEKIVVQRIGAELSQFKFQPRVWTSGTPLKVLLAATFVEKKGIPYGIRALGLVAKNHSLKITIVGDAKDNQRSRDQKKEILNAIEQAKLSNSTELLGFVSQAELLKIALDHHLFLSPSVTSKDGDNEGGSPVAITELAATGMPIVSTVHCDIPEVIIDGKTGWLAKERDEQHLARKIEQALSENQNWPQILSASREHLELNFDLAKQGRVLAQVYSDLVS